MYSTFSVMSLSIVLDAARHCAFESSNVLFTSEVFSSPLSIWDLRASTSALSPSTSVVVEAIASMATSFSACSRTSLLSWLVSLLSWSSARVALLSCLERESLSSTSAEPGPLALVGVRGRPPASLLDCMPTIFCSRAT